MNFYSESYPMLIQKNTMDDINKKLDNLIGNNTNETSMYDYFYNLYENYVQPNLFILLLLFIFVLFLLYKYYTKSKKKDIIDDKIETIELDEYSPYMENLYL